MPPSESRHAHLEKPRQLGLVSSQAASEGPGAQQARHVALAHQDSRLMPMVRRASQLPLASLQREVTSTSATPSRTVGALPRVVQLLHAPQRIGGGDGEAEARARPEDVGRAVDRPVGAVVDALEHGRAVGQQRQEHDPAVDGAHPAREAGGGGAARAVEGVDARGERPEVARLAVARGGLERLGGGGAGRRGRGEDRGGAIQRAVGAVVELVEQRGQ